MKKEPKSEVSEDIKKREYEYSEQEAELNDVIYNFMVNMSKIKGLKDDQLLATAVFKLSCIYVGYKGKDCFNNLIKEIKSTTAKLKGVNW